MRCSGRIVYHRMCLLSGLIAALTVPGLASGCKRSVAQATTSTGWEDMAKLDPKPLPAEKARLIHNGMSYNDIEQALGCPGMPPRGWPLIQEGVGIIYWHFDDGRSLEVYVTGHPHDEKLRLTTSFSDPGMWFRQQTSPSSQPAQPLSPPSLK